MNREESKGSWGKSLADHRAVFVLLAAALTLRIWNLTWGLPQLYEEAIPLRFGMKLWNLTKDPIDFHFFVYPSFTYLVQFLLQTLHFIVGYIWGSYASADAFINVYLANPTTFAVIARMTSVLFDVGSVLVVYLFLLDFSDKRTAIVAAFLLSINPLHVAQAHLINVDTPFTFFCLLALYFFYKCYRQPVRKWFILSGIATGLATATKYHGLLLVLAFAGVQLFRSRTIAQSVRSLKAVPFIQALALSGAVFLIFNPFIFPHFDDFMLKLKFTELHMEEGHLGLDPNTSTFAFYFLQSLPQYLGLVFVAFSTGSMIYLIATRDRRHWLMLSIPILLLILLGSWKMRADRYILPMVPFLITCGSITLVKIWDYSLRSGWLSKLGGRPKFYRTAVGSAFLLMLSIPMFSGLWAYHRSVMLPDTRTLAKRWIDVNMPFGSAIATGPFGVELTNTSYLTMPIQFSAVNSEQMSPLYDTRWYEDLDLLIASDFDYGRYKQDPIRYRDLLRFYDTLRTTWRLVREIAPNDSQVGPTLWLYKFLGKSSSAEFDTNLIKGLLSAELTTPQRINFLGKLGLILNAKGKPIKSAQALLGVLSLDPDNALARAEINELSRRMNRQNMSESSGEASIEHENKSVALLLKAADEMLNLNNLAGAEKKYREVLAIDNRNDSAYIQLVTIYAILDDQAKVVKTLEEYLKAIPKDDPRHAVVEDQLNKIKAIEN